MLLRDFAAYRLDTVPNTPTATFPLSSYPADFCNLHPAPAAGNTSSLSKHAAHLPVASLAAFVAIVEGEFAEYFVDSEDTEADRHEVTRAVLDVWAEANLWHGPVITADSRSAFIAIIAALDERHAVLPCGVAMGWVSKAFKAGDIATAEALADVLKAA